MSSGKENYTSAELGKPKIGVVGHSRAGKSTFLAVLKTAFENAGWAATARTSGQASNLTDTNTLSLRDPAEYLNFLRRFIENGFFPPSTPIQDTADRVTFDIKGMDVTGKQKSFEIDCFDPAGQLLEGDYDGSSKEIIALKAIQASLTQCTGVLLLLDPETHPDIWVKTWERVEPGLKIGKDLRVAVCFAKADIGLRHRRFRIRDAKRWVQSFPAGLNLVKQIENRILNIKWEFVSSSGWLNGISNTRFFVNYRPIRRTGVIGGNARLRELVPDPAQPVDKAVDGDDTSGFRYMQNLPLFTDPLRLLSHDFRLNPMTDAGPHSMLSKIDNTAAPIAGVHVGYGRGLKKELSLSIRPWNVVEPVLWLANQYKERL